MLGVGIASPAVTTFGLGQGPCSRKVPLAFATSTAIVESETTIAADIIGLLMLNLLRAAMRTGIYARLLTQT